MAVRPARPARPAPSPSNLPGPSQGLVPPARPRPSARKPVTRRSFLAHSWLAASGVALAGFGAGSVYMLWPTLKAGFGTKISVPKATADASIKTDGNYYSPAGRFYLVAYSGNGTDGVYKGVTSSGYMALYQRCVHLGCRVPWCATSKWWECPCHGSQYNSAGEYKLGPAPRGLDRFPVSVDGANIVVDTGTKVVGPPRGTDTTGQQLEGPHCISGGHKEA